MVYCLSGALGAHTKMIAENGSVYTGIARCDLAGWVYNCRRSEVNPF
jgi:hypothetical protein